MLIVLLSKGRALAYPSCAWKVSCLRAGIAESLNPPSGNGLLNYAFVIERNASGREFESVSLRTNSSCHSEQIGRSVAETLFTKLRTILSIVDSTLPRLIAILIDARSQNRYVT
jgi:hypothetical protein